MVVARLMFAGLALSLVAVLPTAMIGTAAAQGPPSLADIQVRDRLVADQEALLNAYRCRFVIDTQAVPGGCQGDQPARPATEPTPFIGTPTSDDLAVRDELVVAQEALLNVYRCRFVIDTQAVPGGCVGGVPTRIQEQIKVAVAPPSGRCAHTIASGSFEWERCAWDGFWDNRIYNHSLSEADGQSLVEKIWAEIDVEGKPATPPTSEVAPAGATCATAVEGGVIVACYQHSSHHLRRLDSSLQTILHETAHALVALHPSIQACQTHSDPRVYDACVHNDVFRCAADHLFVRYAGIPSAGVCGTTGQRPTLPSGAHEWVSTELDGGGRIAGVSAYFHNRGFPDGDSDDWLFVRCGGEGLEVFLDFERGSVAGQRLYAGLVPVIHVFLPSAFFSWEEAIQNDFVASNEIRGLWGESTHNSAVFLPKGDEAAFINSAVSANRRWLMVSVENWDGAGFGVFVFSLEDASVHVRPVAEGCGRARQ
ncbi:MAG: hypothetical protein OXN95_02525 [bacterium]|nr:hypothetical protein [bacterium]